MAVHNVAAGNVAKHNITLQANVVDAVNFDDDPTTVEIVSDGAAKIYVTVDGTEPTVGGDNTYLIPAIACVRTIDHGHSPAAVKLKSPGAPTVSVTSI